MPWSSQAVIAQTVIIEGASDGLFVYNGTPAAGNLIASIASVAGTDQFGNTFQAGVTSYGSAGATFVELNGGLINFFTTGSVLDGQIVPAARLLQISPAASALTDQVPAISMSSSATSPGVPGNVLIATFGASGNIPPSVTSALLELQGIASPTWPIIETLPLAAGNEILGSRVTATDSFDRFQIAGDGTENWGPGTAGPDCQLHRPSANLMSFKTCDLKVESLGRGLLVREGANCKQGTATLSAGTILVSNTSVTATSRIFLTPQDNSTTGALRVSARVAGTSFTITSSNAGDSGVVAYEIFEPG